MLMSDLSVTCKDFNKGQATLHWTSPTDTGGQGVDIKMYLVDVIGPAGYTCPSDQCNVTTTNTTITGLLCNTSYTVTVRAVNCRGVSAPSQAIEINTPGMLQTIYLRISCVSPVLLV